MSRLLLKARFRAGHDTVAAGMNVQPRSVEQAGPDALSIVWSDGEESVFKVFDLRLACPCAGCVDEITGAKLLDPNRIPSDVKPVKVFGVGNYAIQIKWSDGHDTGIYSFERLRELSQENRR